MGQGVPSIQLFLDKRNVVQVEQSTNSPDLDQCDFFLLSQLKGIINGSSFEGVGAIKRAVETELSGIVEKIFSVVYTVEVWKKTMGKRIRLKRELSSLLFGVEINCL